MRNNFRDMHICVDLWRARGKTNKGEREEGESERKSERKFKSARNKLVKRCCSTHGIVCTSEKKDRFIFIFIHTQKTSI